MQINWFTVIAQVINFFILVWLLKRFLYKPILKAVDEREKKITSQLDDAKSKKAEAKKEQDEFTEKNEAFDKKKKELMDKAIADTKVERDKLMDEARNDYNTQRSKQEKALIEIQENLTHEIIQKTQKEVFAISGKALSDLATVSLEEQVITVFIQRLKELKAVEKKKFIAAFKEDHKPVLIRSTFELPIKQQTELKKAIIEAVGVKTHFEFKITPELISGIELSSNGYKLAWSIAEYLNSIQKNTAETLKEKTKVEPEKNHHASK